VRLRGDKDNLRAVGAIVEVRAREIYRRIYYRGEPELVGVGPHERIDVLRVRWPNGAVQSELDAPLEGGPLVAGAEEEFHDFLQTANQAGSCPFLYAWNGTTYGFVSDVLGITPLGLPMAPGMLVPPDHDEYVLVRGDQLEPREGRYELQFTEELREVTYLDRARLEVVDHPADVEVFPNERFCFPPFPEPWRPRARSMRRAATGPASSPRSTTCTRSPSSPRCRSSAASRSRGGSSSASTASASRPRRGCGS
jgi:hypothetical protein